MMEKKTSPVHRLIDHFFDLYYVRFGYNYTVSGARDGRIMKALLKDHTEDTLRECIELFMEDNDPWLMGGRFSIPTFRSRINQYIQLLAYQERAAGSNLPNLAEMSPEEREQYLYGDP